MMRTADEDGGIAVYARNLVGEMIAQDSRNEYLLLYRTERRMGGFRSHPNVTEVLVRGRSTAFWDQVAVPWTCWRRGADVLLHPKFTVPFLAPCKSVMVLHGADWLVPEQARFYPRWNVRYMRLALPLYARRAAAVVSVSELTTQYFQRAVRLPAGKVRTIYFGPAGHFRRVHDTTELDRVRRKYELPDSFIFTLTKPKGEERKNLANLLSAYGLYHERSEHPAALVVGGRCAERYREQCRRSAYGSDVHFPELIDQADMPAVFSLADLYLYPSRLEAFPIPLTEAMACGTPIVTSNVNGLAEIAGDAGLQADPEDPAAIADAVTAVMSSSTLRTELVERGLRRVRRFSWKTSAESVLALLESLVTEGDAAVARSC